MRASVLLLILLSLALAVVATPRASSDRRGLTRRIAEVLSHGRERVERRHAEIVEAAAERSDAARRAAEILLAREEEARRRP